MRAVRTQKPEGQAGPPQAGPYVARGGPDRGKRGGDHRASAPGKLDPIGGSGGGRGPGEYQLPSVVTGDGGGDGDGGGARRFEGAALHIPGEPRYDSQQSPSPSPPHSGQRQLASHEREAELDGLIAEYEDAVDGLNNDREVLQLEVQRVLQLERQREEELAHAVNVNQSLNEEIAELRESITQGGEAAAQRTLLEQFKAQVEALQFERDKALLEVDSLYAEVQSLQSRSPLQASPERTPPKTPRDAEAQSQLEQEVVEMARDLDHGYKVMEALRDEGDEFSSQVRQHLRALSKDKDQMLRAVTDINAKLRHLLPDTWAQDGQDMDEVLLRKVAELEKELKLARQGTASLDAALLQVEQTGSELRTAQQTCEQLRAELAEAQRSMQDAVTPVSPEDSDTDIAATAMAENKRLQQVVDGLRDELEAVRQEAGQNQRELAEVQASAADAELKGSQRQSALEAEVAVLGAALEEEKAALAAARRELEEGGAAEAGELEELQAAMMDMKMKADAAAKEAKDVEKELEEEIAALTSRLQDEAAQREAAQRALAKMMDSEEGQSERYREQAAELQRKLSAARDMEEVNMGTVKELNDRVRELEALVTAAQSETAAAKEDSLGAHGKVRALEEALLAASRQGEKAAAQLGDALAQEAASASERAEASRQASEQLNSVIIQRDKLEAKCTVQARELLSADAQLKELRQALKGSGMLDKAQADDLMQQLREAQREAEELRVAHSSSAEDGMAHVRQELGALMDGLADAKRVQQTFIQEEGEARQLLERHVRRGLADLQAKLSTVHREVDSAVGSPASSPSSPQRSPSLHLNLSSLKPPDHGLEERVRDLEARNRQLEQQARMLISSREMDILEKDRIVREAEQVRAESESRLWSTLQDQEEELHRRAQGSGERRDAEGQKYRRLRGRIEELEEQLRGKIRQLESDKVAPDGLRRQMEELMGAQRSVQSALEKLVVSQTALQEQQQQLTSRQDREQREVRRSLEGLRAATSSPPSPRGAYHHTYSAAAPPLTTPLASSPPQQHYALRPSPASWAELSLPPYGSHHSFEAPPLSARSAPGHLVPGAPWGDGRVLAYSDLAATPSPAAVAMYGLSPPGADWAGPAATPGSGVSFATLNMFAPPSWRAARGLAPTQPNTTP
eukprot:jgi/Tetstr1/434951/TSEL_023945.t1